MVTNGRVSVTNLISCQECLVHYFDQPFLGAALASVGIERGLSSGEMLVRYMDEFHKGGHKIEREGSGDD